MIGLGNSLDKSVYFFPKSCFVSGKNRAFCVEFLKVFRDTTKALQGKCRKRGVCLPLLYLHRDKAIPGQALGILGSWSSENSRQSAYEFVKVISSTQRPNLLPVKYSWYLLPLEAETTPVSQCGRLDYVNEKFQWPHREIISTWRKIKFSKEIIICQVWVLKLKTSWCEAVWLHK
jgi:hypothetical protein